MQNRVLDAAAVEIDRHPVGGRRRVERQLGVAADRRTAGSTTTSRRTCPSCRSRAGRDRRTSDTSRSRTPAPAPAANRRGPVNVVTFGSSTGSCSYGTGTTPSFSQWIDRDRRAPVALPRDAPVLEPVLHLAVADAALLGVGNHPRDHGRRFLRRRTRRSRPACRSWSSPRSCVVGGRRRRRRAGRRCVIGRLYLRANSKSRSSCAGTAMIAPVPYSARHEIRDPDRHRPCR